MAEHTEDHDHGQAHYVKIWAVLLVLLILSILGPILAPYIEVGFMKGSPSEMVGNSSGTPPAFHTPRFTASATSRRCRLQWFNSLQELQMPTTGLSSKMSRFRPSLLR